MSSSSLPGRRDREASVATAAPGPPIIEPVPGLLAGDDPVSSKGLVDEQPHAIARAGRRRHRPHVRAARRPRGCRWPRIRSWSCGRSCLLPHRRRHRQIQRRGMGPLRLLPTLRRRRSTSSSSSCPARAATGTGPSISARSRPTRAITWSRSPIRARSAYRPSHASTDPDAFLKARENVLYGKVPFQKLDVNEPNSIRNRLDEPVRYLAKKYPKEGWDQYLDEDGSPPWSSLAWPGNRRGAGTPRC